MAYNEKAALDRTLTGPLACDPHDPGSSRPKGLPFNRKRKE